MHFGMGMLLLFYIPPTTSSADRKGSHVVALFFVASSGRMLSVPDQNFLRSSFLSTLPLPVLGNTSKNSTERGHLKRARRPRQNSNNSFSVACAPGLSTTSAFGASPHLSSGTGITATSYTHG